MVKKISIVSVIAVSLMSSVQTHGMLYEMWNNLYKSKLSKQEKKALKNQIKYLDIAYNNWQDSCNYIQQLQDSQKDLFDDKLDLEKSLNINENDLSETTSKASLIEDLANNIENDITNSINSNTNISNIDDDFIETMEKLLYKALQHDMCKNNKNIIKHKSYQNDLITWYNKYKPYITNTKPQYSACSNIMYLSTGLFAFFTFAFLQPEISPAKLISLSGMSLSATALLAAHSLKKELRPHIQAVDRVHHLMEPTYKQRNLNKE